MIEAGLKFFDWIMAHFGPLNGVLIAVAIYVAWLRHLESKAHDLTLERMLAMQSKFAEVQLAQAGVLAELRLLLTPNSNYNFNSGKAPLHGSLSEEADS